MLLDGPKKNPSSRALHTRRFKRYLVGIALFFAFIGIVVLTQHFLSLLIFGRPKNDKLTLHRYGSKPQDGMPVYPFDNNEARQEAIYVREYSVD